MQCVDQDTTSRTVCRRDDLDGRTRIGHRSPRHELEGSDDAVVRAQFSEAGIGVREPSAVAVVAAHQNGFGSELCSGFEQRNVVGGVEVGCKTDDFEVEYLDR